MEIRKINKKDFEEVSQLIKQCFLNLSLGGHTKKGIELQIKSNSPENLERHTKSINYFVAVDNNKIIGICGFDINRIHKLFVDVNYHNKGVGPKLLSYVLNEAKNEGLKSIKTWSTFNAEKFYNFFGFIKKREIYLPEGSKDIILIEMEKIF
jgi:N-acetylglutamate synthase-like GNAT family acetyltransferase